MSNTPKTPPDTAAIDASISVLGEEGGEAKVTDIERGVETRSRASVEQAGSGRGAEGAQHTLEAPISESGSGGSVERPGDDPDRV